MSIPLNCTNFVLVPVSPCRPIFGVNILNILFRKVGQTSVMSRYNTTNVHSKNELVDNGESQRFSQHVFHMGVE